MTDINLNKICDLLNAGDIPAYVEHTGGGCATIYAGVEFHDNDIDEDVFPALAGPGWFTDGGAFGDWADFYVGPDDQGVCDDIYRATEADTEETIAAKIAEQVRKVGV